MKKRFFKGLVFGAAGLFICFILYASGISVMENFRMANEQTVIKHLLSARIDAMNQFYASEISYMEASAALRRVEAGHLLEEDSTSLRRYFRTDIEEIQTYTISRIELKDRTADFLCAEVDIQWNVTGLDGAETLKNTYFTMCEKDGEAFKLTEFF